MKKKQSITIAIVFIALVVAAAVVCITVFIPAMRRKILSCSQTNSIAGLYSTSQIYEIPYDGEKLSNRVRAITREVIEDSEMQTGWDEYVSSTEESVQAVEPIDGVTITTSSDKSNYTLSVTHELEYEKVGTETLSIQYSTLYEILNIANENNIDDAKTKIESDVKINDQAVTCEIK